MANVFGNPITDSTLKAMAEYAGKDNITSLDRATVALNMQTANMRDTNGRTYVENLKKQSGDGVATLCLIYNATGNTLTFIGSKDWYGHIGHAPYPMRIRNGQWGAFLHVKSSAAATGSSAAAVFRGKNGKEGNDSKDCDYIMAWSNPWNRTTNDNSVWAEARDVNHFNKYWDVISAKCSEARYIYRDEWSGCLSTIATGSFTSPIVEAVFTLTDAAKA